VQAIARAMMQIIIAVAVTMDCHNKTGEESVNARSFCLHSLDTVDNSEFWLPVF
jgi:hypothetical protein